MPIELEVPAVVEAALAQETFDVLDFVKGAAQPHDTVTIYTNAAAGYELNKILAAEEEAAKNKKKSKKSDTLSLADDDGYADAVASEARISELYESLKASTLSFELQALAPNLLRAIEKEKVAKHSYKEGTEDENYFKDLNYEIFAKTVKGVTNAEGARANTVWTHDNIEAFIPTVHPAQWGKLWAAVLDINYNGQVFDNAVNADFS